MPMHTILGATGATGSAVLRCLLLSEDASLQVNIFVRSKDKLLNAFPALEQRRGVSIFTGSITDAKALLAPLKGASIVHLCIATNQPAKVTTVAFQVAESVNIALQQIRSEEQDGYVGPTVLINRATPLNPELQENMPGFMHTFLCWVLSDIYQDLENAVQLYKSAERDGLLSYIILDPPALYNAETRDRTGFKLIVSGEMSPSLNYEDLGAAFLEAAQRKEEFLNKAIGVRSTGKVQAEVWITLTNLFNGLRVRLLGF